MISVVIPVAGEEPGLFDTLSALVPAAADGLVRDVVLATAAADAFTRRVADAAGCAVLETDDPTTRLAEGAKLARARWLLVLLPGFVPAGAWMAELADFVAAQDETAPRAAVFTRLAMPGRRLSAALANASVDLLGRAGLEQGLVARRDKIAQPGRVTRLASPLYDRRSRRG